MCEEEDTDVLVKRGLGEERKDIAEEICKWNRPVGRKQQVVERAKEVR